MSKQKRSLAEQIQDVIDMLGRLLNPQPTPAPQPIPARNEQRYPPRQRK